MSLDTVRPGKWFKDQLASQYSAFQANPTEYGGLTGQARANMIANAQRAAGAQQQANISSLNRSAMGEPGFQAGAINQGIQGIDTEQQAAAAQTAGEAGRLDAQLKQQAYDQLMSDIKYEREQKKQRTQEMVKQVTAALSAVTGFMAGGPGGAVAAAGSVEGFKIPGQDQNSGATPVGL